MQPFNNAIFISKDVNDVSVLTLFAEINNIELYASSLITFESVHAKISATFDVIFFGSPRAVHFYFVHHQTPKDVSFACVGHSTAKKLSELGHVAEFVGEENKNISNIALDFKAWLGNRLVLFPLSDKSFRTFSSLLPEHQKTEVIVYRTMSNPKSIPDCQYYVFTSPSNVDSFLSQNSIAPDACVISWGESTHRHLQATGQSSEMLANPSVGELIIYLNKKGGFRLP